MLLRQRGVTAAARRVGSFCARPPAIAAASTLPGSLLPHRHQRCQRHTQCPRPLLAASDARRPQAAAAVSAAAVAAVHVRGFAGHSKWANIQHKKAANDKKRAKIFTKLVREIEHAVRAGGGDTPDNLLLQGARAKATQFNLPKDKVEAAVTRASTGDRGGAAMEVVTYEATGPKGVALLVEALTDNRNRTAKEIRHIVTKHGGSLDSKVMWIFNRCGDIRVPADLPGDRGFDDLFDEVLMADGVLDVREDPDDPVKGYQILVEMGGANGLLTYLREEADPPIPVASYAAVYIPETTVELVDEEDVANFESILETLDDQNDVQEIFHNAS